MQLTQRPLHKEFIRFVVPSVAAQWVFALYTMVDGMFVSRGVSEIALAAVNLSLPFVNFIFAISLILAVGTSTIVSICFGKKDADGANRIYSQNFLVVIGAGLFFTLLILLNLNGIARFLGADSETFSYVRDYVGTVACFTVFFMISYYFEILIKADGRPKMATIMVTTGAVLNCILDYVFVFVVKWGVFGAALATGLSQVAVSLCFLVYFLGPKARLKLTRFSFSGSQVWRTFRLGLPSGITDFSAGLMIFLFNHAILTYLGNEAIVSYTIVAYVNTIIVMSMTGIAQGMQPLVSFYHGKNRRDISEKLLRYAMITAVGLSVVITVPTWLGARGIVSIFISPDLAVLRAYSVHVFRIFSLSFLVVGFNVVLSGYFTAIEWDAPAMGISLARGFVFIALSLWILISLLGGEGIWWAALLSEVLCLGLSLVFWHVYRRSPTRQKALEQS